MRTMGYVAVLLLLVACSGTNEPGQDLVNNSDVKITAGEQQVQPADEKSQPPADVVAKPDLGLPPGYLEFCLSDGDCSPWGLTCISESVADQDAFCSQVCAANEDCPETLLCKPKGEIQACRQASFCDLCQNDEQCGQDGRCIEDEEGTSFCSYPCKKDDPEGCGAGNFCNKVGVGLEDYFCFPMFGRCKGDGSHCTPCQDSDDCLKGHQCHENPTTFERYCAKVCQTKMDCPKGFGCHELPGEELPLCTLEVNELPVETCYKGNKDFCEPCMLDYECQSGLCYNYPVAGKYFCSFACDYDEYPQEGCPTGLFCVPNHGESGGKICAPSLAFGCQGFLNCIAVDCPKGEKCVSGFCQPK
jgi:hypothetical protein